MNNIKRVHLWRLKKKSRAIHRASRRASLTQTSQRQLLANNLEQCKKLFNRCLLFLFQAFTFLQQDVPNYVCLAMINLRSRALRSRKTELATTPKSNILQFPSAAIPLHVPIAEVEIKKALENREFQLHYQPIIDLQSSRLVGFEALLRWHHPTKGMIPPGHFIPLIEETHWMVPVGRWILTEACQQLQAWQQQHVQARSLMLNINLSSHELEHPDFVAGVKKVLHETGIDPRSLKFEITETAKVKHVRRAVTALIRLKRLGIQIYIDDFGTGYSSLSYLHQFPVNGLKLDRFFIKRFCHQPIKLQIVKSILTLSQELNVDVVAEGIETLEQYQSLKALGCQYGQGYLFSKPLDAKKSERLILDPKFASRIIKNNFAGRRGMNNDEQNACAGATPD